MIPSPTASSRILKAGWHFVVAILVLVALSSRQPTRAADLEQWLQTEKAVATQQLIGNVLSNGAVIASPSTANPNYYFHWVRDGALAMDTVISLYTQSSDAAERQRYWALLTAYLDFSLQNQVTNNPRSEPGRGLGEPKFNTDGSAFTDDWGRPQDDGPALRAMAFTRLANYLLDNGDTAQLGLVKTKLYDSTLPTNSVIKRDLEYVSHNWPNTCFDPWEEVRGHHFYTRMVERRALIEGAALARRLNDGGAADWYSAQASALEPALRGHWDQVNGIIRVTLDRDGGLSYKASNLDAAVVLAVLHANRQGDDFFSPTDDMVSATAASLSSTFDNLFPINQAKQDFDGAPLGTAIGRYPEDCYSGQAGTNVGNAWVLCTAGMAELYYRAASEWTVKGQIAVTDRNKGFFLSLDPSRFQSLQPGQFLINNDPAFQDVIAALRSAGDRQLRRVKYHAFLDGSLSEQMNRQTGFMQSARDLTWNYASILTVLGQRTAIPPTALVNGSSNGLAAAGSPAPRAAVGIAAIPINRIALVPMTRLNRGGIPIPSIPVKTEAAFAPRPVQGHSVTGAETEPSQDLAALRKAIEELSEEVRALRAERGGNAPPQGTDHRTKEPAR
ncbi:MAG TPA: glycoside hydrolase family 15 protein [Pirellulales bacterium]|jgi:glucoamylase|nr:glycoside hydrolase family 15 protein [Pirellulales bacterium]